MNDPIVEEVRRIRNEHAKSFNYDLDAICNDFKSKHKVYVERLANIKDTKKATKRSNH